MEHIDFECPNQKVIALIKEEDVEVVVKFNHVQEDEKSSLLSKSELDVEKVVKSNHVQEDEKSSLLSKSNLEIKVGSDVMALVFVEEI